MSNRVEKSKRNAKFGLASQALYLILAFVLRIAITRSLGIVALSLNGLFSEVLSILSLAEMGVGLAITYNLYEPLSKGDKQRVAQIMNLLKRFYRAIFWFIMITGLALTPWIQKLVNDIQVSLPYLRLVYILFVFQTAAGYLFSYKTLLLIADQNAYVQSKLNLIWRSVFAGISLFAVAVLKNYIVYLISESMFYLVFYWICDRKISKMYPYLSSNEQLPDEDKKKILTGVKQMFVGKLSNKILNSTDNILISLLVGTSYVGVYSQYSMFTNGFLRLFSSLNESIVGSVGNLIASESAEKVRKTLDQSTYLFFLAAIFCGSCLYAGIDPFLKAVMGKDYLLPRAVIALAVLNMMYEALKMPLWTFFSAAGLFKEDQWISLSGAILNVIVSIWWGKFSGMTGIFAGTFVSLLLMQICKAAVIARRFPDGNNAGKVLGKWAIYLALFVLALHLNDWVALWVSIQVISGIAEFALRVIIAALISLALGVLPFMRTEEFTYARGFISQIVHRKAGRSDS